MDLIKIANLSRNLENNNLISESRILDNILIKISGEVSEVDKLKEEIAWYHKKLHQIRDEFHSEPDQEFFDEYQNLIDELHELESD